MNDKHLIEICDFFTLGTPTGQPSRVHGGLLHKMWRVNTNKGSYAIKQLSKRINLKDNIVKENYELTEDIAFRFINLGIPGVSAVKKAGRHLIEIDSIGYLIYPWIEAKALDQDAISEQHAIEIAQILARMHIINLTVPEIVNAEFDLHSNDKLIELFNNAEKCSCPFTSDLKENKNNILTINSTYQDAIPILKQQLVISHGDLDQKNVLWDQAGNPILIDWESARKLNPIYEIVNNSLDWSGITTNFNKDLFIKMINAYEKAGGLINKNYLEAALYGVLGNWINWLVYNIERSCNTEELEQKNLGTEQVSQTLNTILRLEKIIPELTKIIVGTL